MTQRLVGNVLRDARIATETATLIRLSRAWRNSPHSAKPDFPVVKRLALLSGATTETLAPLLELAAAARGIGLEIWQGTYGGYVQDALAEHGPLYSFRPDIVHFVLGPHLVGGRPRLEATRPEVEAEAARQGRRLVELAKTVQERTGAFVTLDNFPEPAYDPMGGAAGLTPGSLTAFTRAVNLWLIGSLPTGVYLHDVWRLAGECGTRVWLDPRSWFHSKQPVSLEVMGVYVQSLCSLLAALCGRAAKVLVLDVDGTLWGGVVGEDGVEGIRLGEGSAEGEAFKAFQLYCRDLRRRGVLLAVCSKNDEATARLPFEQHPECVLKLDDFVAFKANWEDKPHNLADLAQELNLGLHSFVFCDNDAVERASVAALLPEVVVVALPDDPAGYIGAVAATRSFDAVGLRAEDLGRTSSYRASQFLRTASAGAAELEDFLCGLEMRAVVRGFGGVDLPRIADLVAKTNQFNLTLRRHPPARLQQFGEDPRGVCFSVRLMDRLADHGLIAVVVGMPAEEGVLEIDTWVMSCRVLNRGIEVFTLKYLCDRARALGYRFLQGKYRAGPRNGLVATFYSDLGFEAAGEGEQSRWLLSLSKPAELRCYITEVDSKGE